MKVVFFETKDNMGDEMREGLDGDERIYFSEKWGKEKRDDEKFFDVLFKKMLRRIEAVVWLGVMR